jgi:hypothetical protein
MLVKQWGCLIGAILSHLILSYLTELGHVCLAVSVV